MPCGEAAIKRVIKAYLHFKGEATSKMILEHLIDVDYGIHKTYSTRALSAKLKYWSRPDKSGEWFRITSTEKNGQTWWRLK